jgi:hypothetical protein
MSNDCEHLHELCNGMKRFHYGDRVPQLNGIEFAFEVGETAHGRDRIVRVGESGWMPQRISQHFSDGFEASVFKKWVFGAVIRKTKNNAVVDMWAKIKRETADNPALINESVEYMREKMSFVIFDSQYIQKLKSKLIATVSACDCCAPSANWLGRNACKNDIRDIGLWQVIGVKQPGTKLATDKLLTESDWSLLEKAAVR